MSNMARLAAALACTAVATTGAFPTTTPAAAAATAAGCDYSLAVYLGNGCFWHTQYDFYTVEIDAGGPFQRGLGSVTGRVGYAGGHGTSPQGQVCYHGGPAGSEYENMAYAEAVQVMLTANKEEVQFAALAKKYFEDTFHDVGGTMVRGDPGDRGPPYRNVIGIPGGVKGPLYRLLVAANIHGMPLVEGGKGGDPSKDTIDQGTVYVYCSLLYPFYRGEQYHMFHPNVVLGRDVPGTYLNQASQAARARHWVDETCAETDVHTTNVEVVAQRCSAADTKTGQWLPGRGATTTAASATTTAAAAAPAPGHWEDLSQWQFRGAGGQTRDKRHGCQHVGDVDGRPGTARRPARRLPNPQGVGRPTPPHPGAWPLLVPRAAVPLRAPLLDRRAGPYTCAAAACIGAAMPAYRPRRAD